MSWNSKIGFFFVSLAVATTAQAQRISFGGTESRATLQTQLVSTNGDVAPLALHLMVPALDLETSHDGFQKVSVEGLTPMDIAGNPDVAATGSLIAVPEGYAPVLTILKANVQELAGVTIEPAQKKYRCDCAASRNFQFNAPLYQSGQVYPAKVAELEEVGRMQGLHLMRVALHPLQVELANHALRVTSELDVRVDFQRTGSNAQPIRLSHSFYRIARTAVANGNGLGRTVLSATGPETLLIFVADSLQSSIQPLVDWKRSKGLNVVVTTATQAGGTKESISSFIKQYYNSHDPKPSYLLFVGNKDTMPTFMLDTSSGSAATDYSYALVNGRGTNLVPDMLYGRLVANDTSEVSAQVSRWIDYEKSPEKGAAWYADGTTIASDQGSSPSDKEYAQQIQTTLKAHTYKTVDGFFQGDGAATFANISGALVRGSSWVAYFGHGSGTSWGSTNDTFDVEAVGRLTNGNHLPFIVDVACLNASWVDIDRPFGKAWVTQQSDGKNVGAVAFLGGSVSVSWNPPAVMSEGIAQYHFQKPVYTAGGSWIAGQMYLIEKMGTGDDVKENLVWYNLLGDPSLVLRTDTPKAYQVKPFTRRTPDGIVVSMSATAADGTGVSGLLAAVSTPDGTAPLATAQTDAQGRAQLTLPGTTHLAGSLLTTTGYNAATVQTTLR